jgi:hypothetical protein
MSDDLSLTTHLDGELRNGRHHMQVRVYYEDTDFSTTLYDAAPVRDRDVVRQPIDRGSLKPDLRLERRSQGGQDETQKPDHSASLGDSVTSSKHG